MSVFQMVRAQLGDNLLERICKRHNDNKQTFFELLQTMTGVKIDPQMNADCTYVIEGTWEALERCHTVLYKYQAELCAEELADLGDQQQYPLLTPNSVHFSSQSKKPSPDSTSCAPLEPITPNSSFNLCSDNRMPSPVISALSLSQALYDRSANSPVVSRGLDLSLKSMTHPLGLFGSVTAGGQISPPTAISTTAIQTAALNLASVGCLPLGGHGNLSNGISHQLEASGEDENDNGSFDECSDYSNDSPVDIESTTTSNKSALDCLMDMKIEPPNIKCSDSQFMVSSPQSEAALSINGDMHPNVRSKTPNSMSSTVVRQRKPNSGSRSRPVAGGGASPSPFMPNKTDQTKVHPCPFCPVTLGSSMNLKKHIQRKHSTPLHKCDICGKAYGFVNDLREHKKIHFLNLPCNQCDKVFKSRRSLLGHLSIAHKDSGVPPPPPPPSGNFTSPLSQPNTTETISRSSTATSLANGITRPDFTESTAQQQLNLSLYSSLSAINSYFSGAGLDVDIMNGTSSQPEKTSPFPTNSVAQNLLSEFDKRLGIMSSTTNGNIISRSIANSVVPTSASLGDVLNLTKSDFSENSLKSTYKDEAAPKPLRSATPMEVSVQ